MGEKIGTASFLQILAPELNDRMLADFLDMDSSIVVTMHVRSVDQIQAIKTIKRKITDLDKSVIDEQKKAVPLRLRYGNSSVRPCHIRK